MGKLMNKWDGFFQKYKIYFILIEIIALSQPAYFSSCIPVTTKIWRMIFIASFILVLFEFVRQADINDYLKMALPVGAYVIICFSTYVNEGELKSAIYRLWYYSYALMLVKIYSKDDLKTFLRVFRDILFILIALNFLSELIWPRGLYSTLRINSSEESRYWFLGFKNGIPKHLVIALTISGLYYYIEESKINLGIYIATAVITIISVFKIKSSSGIVGMILLTSMLAVVFFRDKKYVSRIASYIKMRFLSVFVVLAFVGVVLTHFLLTNPISVFVTGLLNRTITLSNRIYIWDNILKITSSNILGGIGLQGGDTNVKLIGVTENATDSHDFYLEYLWEGGIGCFVLMVLFMALLVYILNRHHQNTKAKVLTSGLFTMMIIFITENCNNYFLWIFFGIILFGTGTIVSEPEPQEAKKKLKTYTYRTKLVALASVFAFVSVYFTALVLANRKFADVVNVKPAALFSDIKYGEWYENAVDFVYYNKIMTGTSQSHFSPYGNILYGQSVVILYRIAGEPELLSLDYLDELEETHYYDEELEWCREVGIDYLNANGDFLDDQKMLREDFIFLLYKYSIAMGILEEGAYFDYADAICDLSMRYVYVTAAMKWAQDIGLIGVESELRPRDYIQRAEAATVITRFIEYYDIDITRKEKIAETESK